MDGNIINCPKCGHGVSATAKTCTYCGTAISSNDPSLEPEAKAPNKAVQPVTSSAPPAGGAPAGLKGADASAGTAESSAAKGDNGPSRKQETKAIRDENQTATAEAGAGTGDRSAGNDDMKDDEVSIEELTVDPDAQPTQVDQQPAAGLAAVSVKTTQLDDSFDLDDTIEMEVMPKQPAGEAIALTDAASDNASDNSAAVAQAPPLDDSAANQSAADSPEAEIPGPAPDEGAEPDALIEPKASRSVDGPAAPDNQDEETEAILLTDADGVETGTPSTEPDNATASPTQESAAPAADTASADPSSAAARERAKVEALRKQTETQAAVEPNEPEKAAPDPTEAQKKQKAVEALKRKKLAQAKALKQKKQKLAQAQKRKQAEILKAQALKKQKAAQAAIEKGQKQKAAGPDSRPAGDPDATAQAAQPHQTRATNTKMLGLLKKYEGRAIGINYDNSADIREAELVEANDEYFSVAVKEQNLSYSHPLKTILTIIEGKDGVKTGKSEQEAKFDAVIKVYPLVLF